MGADPEAKTPQARRERNKMPPTVAPEREVAPPPALAILTSSPRPRRQGQNALPPWWHRHANAFASVQLLISSLWSWMCTQPRQHCCDIWTPHDCVVLIPFNQRLSPCWDLMVMWTEAEAILPRPPLLHYSCSACCHCHPLLTRTTSSAAPIERTVTKEETKKTSSKLPRCYCPGN